MEQAKKERLEQCGIQVEEVTDRFMGNESLLERFLKKFLNDKNYSMLKEAIAQGDVEAAITASHTLKGVRGNLSIKPLFELTEKQVALLRAGNLDEAAAMMTEIDKVYQMVVDTVNEVFS